jgi:hypothetical protein
MNQASPFIPQFLQERFLLEGLIRDGVIQDFETLSLILDEYVQEWVNKEERQLYCPGSICRNPQTFGVRRLEG